MGYKAKNKRSQAYNISLITCSKHKMKENVSKLTYLRLKHCLKALHITNTKCHALVMGNLTENHNRILVIIGYT